MSRKGGTGGGGLVHPESENSMAMYGLAVKIPQYCRTFLLQKMYFKCNGDLENSHFTL